jgi:hypothetical protein
VIIRRLNYHSTASLSSATRLGQVFLIDFSVQKSWVIIFSRESLPRLLVQFVSGSIRYNGEIATEYPEILRYTASLGGKPTRLSTKCPLCVEAQARNPGEDTKDHLFRECPEREKERVALKKALVVAIDEATESRISQSAARKVAIAVMARPDYYAGQIDQAVKIIIDTDNKESGQGWKDSKGEPLQVKQGMIQAAVLSSSLVQAGNDTSGRAIEQPRNSLQATEGT